MLSRKLILAHAQFKFICVSHLAIHAWYFLGTPRLKIGETSNLLISGTK
jgi:hypothetical protein